MQASGQTTPSIAAPTRFFYYPTCSPTRLAKVRSWRRSRTGDRRQRYDRRHGRHAYDLARHGRLADLPPHRYPDAGHAARRAAFRTGRDARGGARGRGRRECGGHARHPQPPRRERRGRGRRPQGRRRVYRDPRAGSCSWARLQHLRQAHRPGPRPGTRGRAIEPASCACRGPQTRQLRAHRHGVVCLRRHDPGRLA